MTPALPPVLAAVDLGSNSFHLLVARVAGGDFQVLDRVKTPVRLAAGLDKKGRLSPAARARALDCLHTFGERVRDLPHGAVRAVGTNTLRRTHNAGPFLGAAAAALGHPIEIIAGREEARLIYLGVYRDVHSPGRRLVVDIGGGSTEIILGDGPNPVMLDSLYMGCVSWSMRFFPEGELRREHMRTAVTAAHLELEAVADRYRKSGWSTALGSSGTVLAIERILKESGLSPEGITPRGLKRLRAAVVEAGKLSRLRLPGLPKDRQQVLPGGLAVLSAVVEALDIPRLTPVQGALREGVLVDLIGRIRHEDVRDTTISRMAERFAVDAAQAARVTETALVLFDQVARAWALDPEVDRPLLGWAARLHEAGMFVAWPGFHKHGAYLLAHADLPGFSRPEQEILAALVLGHRGRLVEARMSAVCPTPPPNLVHLVVLLRLAARLHRSRSPVPLPMPVLTVSGETLTLLFTDGVLAARPLTVADLEEEAAALSAAGFRLRMG